MIIILGYPFVLPDMIGGNGYSTDDPLDDSNPPTKELYLRWLEANVFMPGMQFSFVPWQYDEEVSYFSAFESIVLSFCVALHANLIFNQEKYLISF